ncbi:hypothetical protein Tco_0556441 [Tanacetum coccineum]
MDSMIPLGQKNTLAEYMILSDAENRPPMLDKDLTKKYVELSAAEKIQADCDMKAINIILQGLPADIYSLERECKLYDAFDKFTHNKWESLHKYYSRFTQLINDINIYNMKMEQFQVYTKFLNSLLPEWSKFVTDVKLVKDLHTTNFDQLHAYLEQHELYANEVRLLRERNQDLLAFVVNQQMTPSHFNTYHTSYNNPQLQQQFPPSPYGSIHPNQHYSSTYPSQPQFNHSSIPPSYPYQYQMNHQTSFVPQIAYQSAQVSTQPMTESPLMDSGFIVPVFSPGDDPIACLDKAIAFLTDVASSKFPSTNNQLRTSYNLRNHATIQDGRVTVQQVQGRQGQSYFGTGYKSNATSLWGKQYKWTGKAEAQEVGQILDEEQLAFLADPGSEHFDTYDSDCDEISNAKAVLMANISNYGYDIISEVPHFDTYLNDMENQSVHAIQDFEQSPVVDFTDNEIHISLDLSRLADTLNRLERSIQIGIYKCTNGVIKVLPPNTVEEILAKERERKARTTLLMALPEDHLAKFHKMTYAKEMWEAINRGLLAMYDKKMQKYILKQQFEGFSVSNSEGLHKGYDRFQSLLSQLEIHGAGVSTEDANQKFLRSLPAAWSQTQNVAFVSENTSSTNEVSTAYGASTSSSHNPQRESSSSYTNELMYSFFANQSSGQQLDHEDLEQLDEFNLEEMDLKWQNADLKGIKIVGGEMLDTLDGVDWTSHSEDEQENYALMAYSNSGSDTEREQLGDASIEIQTYTQALKKKLLAEAEKEKEELKAKVEKWHNSSKGLNILLNSQMSARDKAGLGYGNQMHKGILSYENEVFGSVFDSRSSDIEDSPVNDRYAEGMHVVPPPMTGIYIPSGPDVEIDESQYTYGQKQSKSSESDAETSNFASCESNSSVETNESIPKPVANEPKAISDPKVWSGALIIEEYESDSDDEHVSLPTKEQETSSFAFVNTVKHVKTPRQTVKEQNTCSQSPKPDKKDCSGLMSKKLGLGYGFTKKACFKGKGTVQRENKPVWNNVQRLNHQNKFVPTPVLTRTGRFPINTASQAASTNTARKVNTVRPILNEIRPRNNFFKSHSPTRRPFYKTTTPKDNFLNHTVNTAGGKTVSAIGGKRETVVKASTDCN